MLRETRGGIAFSPGADGAPLDAFSRLSIAAGGGDSGAPARGGAAAGSGGLSPMSGGGSRGGSLSPVRSPQASPTGYPMAAGGGAGGGALGMTSLFPGAGSADAAIGLQSLSGHHPHEHGDAQVQTSPLPVSPRSEASIFGGLPVGTGASGALNSGAAGGGNMPAGGGGGGGAGGGGFAVPSLQHGMSTTASGAPSPAVGSGGGGGSGAAAGAAWPVHASPTPPPSTSYFSSTLTGSTATTGPFFGASTGAAFPRMPAEPLAVDPLAQERALLATRLAHARATAADLGATLSGPPQTVQSPRLAPLYSESPAVEAAGEMAGTLRDAASRTTAVPSLAAAAGAGGGTTDLLWPATGRVTASPVKMGSRVVDLPPPDVFAHVHNPPSAGGHHACTACVALAREQYVELRATTMRRPATSGSASRSRSPSSSSSLRRSTSRTRQQHGGGAGGGGSASAAIGVATGKPTFVVGTSSRPTSNVRIRATQEEHGRRQAALAQQARLARTAATNVPLDASRSSMGGGGGGSSFRMTVTSAAGSDGESAGLGASFGGRETVVVAPAHNPLALPFASAERAAARFATAADHAARSLAAEWATQQPHQRGERRGVTAGGVAAAAAAAAGAGDVAPAWLRETAALRAAGDTRTSGSFTPSAYTPGSTAAFGGGGAASTTYGYGAATTAGAPAASGGGATRSALLSTMKQRMDSIISSIDSNIARLSATGTGAGAPSLVVPSGVGGDGGVLPPAAAAGRGSRAA